LKDSAIEKGDLLGGGISNESASAQKDPEEVAVSDNKFDLGSLHEETDSDYNKFAEWTWLQTVDVTSEVDSQKIDSCNSKIINRKPIRATFHRNIEEPTSDTSNIRFGLFDR